MTKDNCLEDKREIRRTVQCCDCVGLHTRARARARTHARAVKLDPAGLGSGLDLHVF